MKIAGTVARGRGAGGLHGRSSCPATRPAMIGLWRESDRLALSSDCFYTIDMWGRDCQPSCPRADLQLRHRAGAREHPQARRARAGGGVARPRRSRDRRRAQPARTGRRRTPERGQARASPAREADGAEQRLQRRGGQRAQPARLAHRGRARRVRAARSRAAAGVPASTREDAAAARAASCCSSAWPFAG